MTRQTKEQRERSVSAWALHGKLVLGSGKTFGQVAAMTVPEFKNFLGILQFNKRTGAPIADKTLKAYQRNMRKLDPGNINYNIKDATDIKAKIKKDLVKAGLKPDVVDKMIRDAELGGALERYSRLRQWLIDNLPQLFVNLPDADFDAEISKRVPGWNYIDPIDQKELIEDFREVWRK